MAIESSDSGDSPVSPEPVLLEQMNQGQGVSFIRNSDYSFALGRTSVQVGLHEVRQLVSVVPLILGCYQEQWHLIAIAGYAGTKSLMIGPNGAWMGHYVPDRLRLHPLVLARNAENEVSLAAQTQSARIFPGGQSLLIDSEGNRTEDYTKLLKRLAMQVAGRALLAGAAQSLESAGLLTRLQDDNPLVSGPGDFFTADLDSLGSVSAGDLEVLREAGGLSLGFAMHFSAGNANKFRRYQKRRKQVQENNQDNELAMALNSEEDFSFNFDQ